MTTRTLQFLAPLALLALAAQQARAEAFTINFDAFAAPSSFTGGTEDAFELTVSGDPLVTEINNDDDFSGVIVGNESDGDESFLTIRRLDGGDFEFASVGMLQIGGTAALRVEGFNNGSSVGVELLNPPSALQGTPTIRATLEFLNTPLDELQIRIRNGAGKMFIDQLRVMPIAENVPDARFWAVEAEDGALHDVDLAAGTAAIVTIVGSENANFERPGGGAAINNVLYHTYPGLSDTLGLHRCDVADGGAVLIEPWGVPGDNNQALTADPTTGTIIGIGPSTDTLYITRIFEGETTAIPSGVLTANLGTDFGKATGAAFDSDTGTVYFSVEETPTDTVHLWSLDIADAGDPGLTPTFVGDTGIISQRIFGNLGSDAQVGLAFDDASDTLVMSSAEGITTRFYILDTTNAAPSFVFSTPDIVALDNLAPQHIGHEVVADSAGPGEIPVALTVDPSGLLYAATDAGVLTSVQSAELVFEDIFPGGFAPGGTDIEFGASEDTGAPDAVYCIDDAGAINILPVSGPAFSFPLAPQGVTTGPEVGMARRGEDLYFTSGMGVPGALYRFDPSTGVATLFSTNIEDDACSLEYFPDTDMFYYAKADDDRVFRYDPVADTSTSVGGGRIGSFMPNFAIDPEGQWGYYAEWDQIIAFSLAPGDSLWFVFAASLPMNKNGLHDLTFAPSSSGSGFSLFVATNGRQDPAPPQILEFGGFPAPPTPTCIGDLDGDADTDVYDFNLFAPAFGSTGLPPFTGGDLDGDGDVDVLDFNIFASDFGCDVN